MSALAPPPVWMMSLGYLLMLAAGMYYMYTEQLGMGLWHLFIAYQIAK